LTKNNLFDVLNQVFKKLYIYHIKIGIMRIILFGAFFMIFISYGFSQSDTVNMVPYSYEYAFVDGVYLGFDQFRDNNPVFYDNIIIESDELIDDFFEAFNNAEQISFYDEYGIKQTIAKSELWGYCKNGRPYVMWNKEFRLLPYIGSISHFVANVTIYHETVHDPFYDPYSYYSTTPNRYYTSELRQMIIDMETGQILDFDEHNVGILLERDEGLSEEYAKLSKRKKRKVLFYFIRRYNDSHLLYFPISESK
jgi:hypothetical protein